jgi:FkbM family methyltransferase
MNQRTNKLLYKKLKVKGIQFKQVCEVGVYLPETSNVIDFIFDGVQTILVEPDTKSIAAIKTFFAQYQNITLYPYAIYDYNGTVKLAKAEASTFISELKASPALINDAYKITEATSYEVPCRIFSEIDTGNIDLLSIDIEGAEWYVLKNMKSQPKILSVETHGNFYQNPFLTEIENWISQHDYQIWYKDQSDTVYLKNGLFELTSAEKIHLSFTNAYLAWRKFKKGFFRKK